MIYLITITLLIVVYVFYKYFWIRNSKCLNETPIETGLPIIGIMNDIGPSLTNYLTKLGFKHGPIFRIKIGRREVLVLNNFDMIKQAFICKGEVFTNRWKTQLLTFASNNSGLIFKDGPVWSEQRNFVLKVLHEFGMGKSRSLEIVQSECNCFLKELETFNGAPVNVSNLIPDYTFNIISKFIMNKRFEHDESLLELMKKMQEQLIKKKDFLQFFYFLVPELDECEWLCTFIMQISSRLKLFNEVHELLQMEIKEHLKYLDMNSEGQDLIDKFLIKQHQLNDKNEPLDSYTTWQLIRNAFELVVAGYDTTSLTLEWGLMFMAKHQDIQNKVHNEIINQIGEERMPTMNDKKSLIYTQAVMDEILRLSSVAPLAIIHRTNTSIILKDYFIPNDILVVSNLFACHTDPSIWKNPLEFYPEHFLSGSDDGKIKYSPKEELIPFGLGKRQCLGESLARMEVFIFLVSILQKFSVKFVEEISEETYQTVLKVNDGFLRFSSIKNFIFKSRF